LNREIKKLKSIVQCESQSMGITFFRGMPPVLGGKLQSPMP